MSKEKTTLTIEIQKRLYDDIIDYCNLNKIDFNEYIFESIKKSFMIDKYGDSPFDNITRKNEEEYGRTHNGKNETIAPGDDDEKFTEKSGKRTENDRLGIQSSSTKRTRRKHQTEKDGTIEYVEENKQVESDKIRKEESNPNNEEFLQKHEDNEIRFKRVLK